MHICKFCRMKKKRSFCCCCCCLYLMLFINYNNKKISRISSYKTVHSSINASTLLNSSEQYLPIIIDNVHSLPYIADQTFEIIVYILFWFFLNVIFYILDCFLFVCLFVNRIFKNNKYIFFDFIFETQNKIRQCLSFFDRIEIRIDIDIDIEFQIILNQQQQHQKKSKRRPQL